MHELVQAFLPTMSSWHPDLTALPLGPANAPQCPWSHGLPEGRSDWGCDSTKLAKPGAPRLYNTVTNAYNLILA